MKKTINMKIKKGIYTDDHVKQVLKAFHKQLCELINPESHTATFEIIENIAEIIPVEGETIVFVYPKNEIDIDKCQINVLISNGRIESKCGCAYQVLDNKLHRLKNCKKPYY